MKRILSVTLIVCVLLSCAAVFSGCGGKKAKDWPVEVAGVTIDKEPEKIVVLNDIHADIIAYIGYETKMVGRSSACDQEYLHSVPVMGTAAEPDVNAIANANADLVIADSTLSPSAKSSIESSGAKVIVLDVPAKTDDLKELYINIGTALGGKETGAEKGETKHEDLFDHLEAMSISTSNIVQTVAYLYLNDKGELCTFTPETLSYEFFSYSGKTNVFVNQKKDTPVIVPQELRLGSPNYIFYDSDDVLTALSANDEYKNVHALKDNHTYRIPKEDFSRCGKSTENALYQMLKYIEESSKATADEATVPPATVAATVAETKPKETAAATTAETTAETTAPTEAAQDDEPIYYADTDDDYSNEEYYLYDE